MGLIWAIGHPHDDFSVCRQVEEWTALVSLPLPSKHPSLSSAPSRWSFRAGGDLTRAGINPRPGLHPARPGTSRLPRALGHSHPAGAREFPATARAQVEAWLLSPAPASAIN